MEDNAHYIHAIITDFHAIVIAICVIINNVVFYFAKDVKRFLSDKWKERHKKEVGFIQHGKP